MSTRIDTEARLRFAPTVKALAPYGYTLAGTHGSGKMSYAILKSTQKEIRIVCDRGYWFIDGDEQGLKTFPSRRTQAAAIKDAIKWMERSRG
ncbi:MAG: hypothetical protein EG825_18405 [Rhodocyclaceae bacterium]|nr:hypothetical protein [Rhodocyclaceae bacterium]